MTRAENFMKRGNCKIIHCSSLSNFAWCDLNSKSDILKLHDNCPNPKCNCQKKLLLRLINICFKVDQLNLNFKKF